ncbi:MAG: class I SAM-dependent methyltransferase [Leptospiraceae bacterium]|nr:class I SAM-dependent methyltransferase [Leptospiraceae bacterium]
MNPKVYSQFYEMEETNWWFKGTRELLLNWIFKDSNNLNKSFKILDIGCGTGVWLTHLNRVAEAEGLDISEEAVEFSAKRGLKITLGSAEKIPFDNNTFDIITAIGVIEHIEDDKIVIQEINRVLKPGGKVVILTSAFNILWSAHDDIVYHVRRYRIKEVTQLFSKNGFEILKQSYFTFFLFPLILPIRVIQRWIGWKPEPEKVTDIMKTNKIVNLVLLTILRIESYLTRFISLPFGVNIVLIAKKSIQYKQ